MKIVSKYPDGMFSWIDLGTTDLEAAHAFYSALFGWTPDNQPLPGGGSYTNFRLDGYTVAGAAEMLPEMKANGVPPAWTSYVSHSDIDTVAARAAEAGGTVFFEPMDVMEYGRMAILGDPTGASFGLWQPKAHIGAQVSISPTRSSGMNCRPTTRPPPALSMARSSAGTKEWTPAAISCGPTASTSCAAA